MPRPLPPDMTGLRDFQTGFAARIRDPKANPRPKGVPARRMRVYEELLFNNINSFLLACYPITRQILGIRAWNRMVRQYFAQHRSHSPLFRDIPRAFLDWISPLAANLFPNRPWLAEFMLYEWLELAVVTSPAEIDWEKVNPDGNLLEGVPQLDPTAQLACFQYPVHCIGPGFKSKVAEGSLHCFLIFRDSTDVVRFIQLTPVAARLLEMVQAVSASGREHIAELGREIAYPDIPGLEQLALAILDDLRKEGAVLGALK